MKRLWLALVPCWLGCTAVVGGNGKDAPMGAAQAGAVTCTSRAACGPTPSGGSGENPPDKVRAAEGNPYNGYQRLAGLIQPGTGEPSGMADRLALRRKSVNDLVREELNSLKQKPQLSKADVERLDLDVTAIRDLENTMTGMGMGCSEGGLDVDAIEAMSSGTAFSQNGKIEEVAKLQIELVGLAFACNSTRVATLQVGDGTDQTRYTIDGRTIERFHWVSHRIQSDGSSGAAIRTRSSGTSRLTACA